jgi:hypothetical protein
MAQWAKVMKEELEQVGVDVSDVQQPQQAKPQPQPQLQQAKPQPQPQPQQAKPPVQPAPVVQEQRKPAPVSHVYVLMWSKSACVILECAAMQVYVE